MITEDSVSRVKAADTEGDLRISVDVRILEAMLLLPLCSGRQEPGTVLDMKSV